MILLHLEQHLILILYIYIQTVYEKFKETDFLFPVYKKGIFISNLESTSDTLKETDHYGAIEVYIKQGSNTIKTQIFLLYW